jgi:1-acyl-sn-glycerol-3-phosphate acyltransferase
MQPPSRAALAWYQYARAVVAAACRSAWRVRVVGAENIPQTTPFILCPVHRSYIDTLLIACIARRRARFMGHSGVFYRPWIARVFSSLGGFPVHPGPDRAALRTCLDGLALGEPLVVFPEGRRSSGATVSQLFNGPAFLAIRANAPIVPVGIGGSERAMPIGAKRLHFNRIAMVVGTPIPPPSLSGKDRAPRRVVEELSRCLHTELQALFDQAELLAAS